MPHRLARHVLLGRVGALAPKEEALMGSYKEQGRGMADEVKGKVKEEIGDATDNPRLENEGRLQKEEGRLRKDVARTEERIKGSVEEMKGSLRRKINE